MKYLWIGPGMGPKTQEEVISMGGKILSAFISQTNLVQGLDSLGIDMDSINGPNMNEILFPTVSEERWSRNGYSKDVCVGYRNIKYLNRLTKERALRKEANAWLKRQQNSDEITVFVYNMHTAYIAAAYHVKKNHPNTKIVLIVPDLPQYMDLAMGKLKKILKAADWKRIQGYMRCIDKYILYAKPMAETLGLKDGQWMVMEGSYDPDILGEPNEKSDKISVMYSGVLDLRYGIPELLDAIKLLDDKYELWLTGDGNAVGQIKERAKNDPRIKYFGFLPSRQDLLNKQASASMLISPRRDDEDASKYCFPSKLFEYMVSGRPVISCYLESIPEEYHQYLIELRAVTPEAIVETIKMSRQALESGNGKEFVIKEKNKYKQAEKMLRFTNKN